MQPSMSYFNDLVKIMLRSGNVGDRSVTFVMRTMLIMFIVLSHCILELRANYCGVIAITEYQAIDSKQCHCASSLR